MTITNSAAQALIYQIGSNLPNNYIQTIEVGYGSGTATTSNVTLVNGSIRVLITGSPNFTIPYKVSFQGDFTSSQMSGLILTEYGLFTSGILGVGSVWQRESFPAITFDGTNELQIYTTQQIIPG